SMWVFDVQLITLTKGESVQADGLFADKQGAAHKLRGLDVSEERTAADKAQQLPVVEVKSMEQVKQLENPDARVVFDKIEGELLGKYADVSQGICPGDTAQLRLTYWKFLES